MSDFDHMCKLTSQSRFFTIFKTFVWRIEILRDDIDTNLNNDALKNLYNDQNLLKNVFSQRSYKKKNKIKDDYRYSLTGTLAKGSYQYDYVIKLLISMTNKRILRLKLIVCSVLITKFAHIYQIVNDACDTSNYDAEIQKAKLYAKQYVRLASKVWSLNNYETCLISITLNLELHVKQCKQLRGLSGGKSVIMDTLRAYSDFGGLFSGLRQYTYKF